MDRDHSSTVGLSSPPQPLDSSSGSLPLNSTSEHSFPLRVDQLDADELVESTVSLVTDSLSPLNTHYPLLSLLTSQPEFQLFIKASLSTLHLLRYSCLPGQDLLSIEYHRDKQGQLLPLNLIRIVRFVATDTFLAWLHIRLGTISRYIGQYKGHAHRSFAKVMRGAEVAYNLVLTLNLLWFLGRHGAKMKISERLNGFTPVYTSAVSGLREVSFEFMDRELLWTSYFEMLTFLLPFINFRSLYRRCKTLLRINDTTPSHEAPFNMDTFTCVLCHSRPTHPVCARPCGHLYCYYCLSQALEEDHKFMCESCRTEISHFNFYIQQT